MRTIKGLIHSNPRHKLGHCIVSISLTKLKNGDTTRVLKFTKFDIHVELKEGLITTNKRYFPLLFSNEGTYNQKDK